MPARRGCVRGAECVIFADDLVDPDGLLNQSFTVKGINEIRAFTQQAFPLLQEIQQSVI